MYGYAMSKQGRQQPPPRLALAVSTMRSGMSWSEVH